MKLRSFVTAAAVLGCACALNAATFNLADGDVAGLISAITTANTNGEDDTINLAANGTYTLTTVNNTETGANGLPIVRTDGGHSITFTGTRSTITRGSGAPTFRIFQIGAASTVMMNGVIIDGGSINMAGGFGANGGGININTATVTMVNCTVSGNSASSSQTTVAIAGGGGIYNSHGTLTLENCTFRGNNVSSQSGNGSSAISDGGAIESVDGIVRMRNCTLSGNFTSATSGNISAGNPDAAGGAIANFGSGAGNASVTMNSCTLTGNFSTNSGGMGGGRPSVGIENSGSTANVIFGNCIFQSTVFSNSSQGAITSAGYNLTDGNGGGFFAGTADQINANAMLGGLGNHGGLTDTHQPLPGSPAIDKGRRDAVASLAATTDQRGVARPFDYPGVGPAAGGDSSDIGAVEMNEFAQTGNIFTVNILDDHDDSLCGTLDCSLTDAIKAANAQAGTDTIRFAFNVVGTINLKAVLPNLSTNMNIEGPGANTLTVRRDATFEFRIFNIDHVTVGISGLTISNGRLTPSGSLGAGIYNNAGTLTLTNCALNGNTGYAAGGLYNGGGTATVSNCTFDGNNANEGGAIDNAALSGNTATMTVTNSTFSGNSAINNGGAVTNGAFAATASLTLINCTFRGNSSPTGGGLNNGASTFGGAPTSATAVVRNTIFRSSALGANLANNGGVITSQGANISNDPAGGPAGTAPGGFLNGTGDLRNTDPKLSAAGLADNGGGINTIALDPTSPAVNNAANAPARDQRNYTRNGPADIGAFELGGQIPVTLANISTRMRVQTGDHVLIGGFIITGTQTKNLIVRAIGPSLPVGSRLADPTVELFNGNQMIASNDNWRTSQETAIQATGVPPPDNLESALVVSLAPGAYTVIVRGVNNGTGIGSVEVFDLDRTVNSKCANISSRGLVLTGDDVMIGGFIVLGQDPQKVVIRAIGPSLSGVGVADALQDPTLEFVDSNGSSMGNDDWMSTQAAEISATGLAPADPRESALVLTLPPGAYTAIVRGKDNTTGVALVEIYGVR